MAVDYLQSPMNGFSFLKKIGVAPQLLAALQDGGWSIKLTAKKISIEKGTVQFTKELPLAVTQAVQANTLLPDQLVELSKAMTTQVTLALQTNVQLGALDPAGEQPLFAPVKTTTKDEMVAKVKAKLSKPAAVGVTEAFFSANAGLGLIDMIKAYRETFGVGLKEAKDAVEAWVAKNKPSVQVPASQTVVSTHAWPCFPLDVLQSAKTVKLRDATKMYQPVQGTSGGSRYFLVAADTDVRIACRYNGSGLSIRIEGPGWKKHQSVIQQNGWTTISPDKDYASVHLEVGGDAMLANKTMGAVLMGLGLPLETPFPNLAVIKGKGS